MVPSQVATDVIPTNLKPIVVGLFTVPSVEINFSRNAPDSHL